MLSPSTCLASGGPTSREVCNYTVAGYARFLSEALEELGIERAHLVVQDFGAAWGLTWAASHADRLASVVLFNNACVSGYRWHRIARIWRTPVLGELLQLATTRRAFRAAMRRDNPNGIPPEFVDSLYDAHDWSTRRAVLQLYRATDEPGALAADLGPALRGVDPPALVIWGALDPYVPAPYAERERDLFPSAEIVILEKSSHWPFADDPQRVGQLVVRFLDPQLGAP